MSIDRLTAALADRYAIEKELGAGGMATVYLAEDLKHHRKVAVKVLRPELAAILGAERFLKEIEVTANLQHPNILPLYDSGEADTALFYVMPLVEGESLQDRLEREKQLPIEEAVAITRSVASALDYAHRQDVIHRDIKPPNIMLTEGQALVADFGIALAVSEAGGERLTETGLSLGTPYYMSPEQATGDRELDARSDVYALGCVTYEMLTGDPPHTGSTAQAIIASVVTEDPRPISARRPSVPPHVEAAVHKAIAKIPADRFPTAARFGDALAEPLVTTTSTRRMQSAAPGSGLWKRLSLTMTVVAAGLLALLLMRGTGSGESAPVIRYSLALPVGEELAATVVRPRIALSPDGRRMVYSGPADVESRLWVRDRDALHATPLFGTELARSPFFSPDGSHVGFPRSNPEGGGQQLLTASLSGGSPTLLLDSIVGLDGGSWGTDGYIYFDGLTGGGTRGIARILANGGPPERVTTVDTARGETDHVWPYILPDANGIVFTVIRDNDLTDADIAVSTLSDDSHRVITRGVTAKYAPSGHLLYVTRDGTLSAAPFDADALELTGDPVVMAEGLNVRGTGAVDFALSSDGRLAYVTGALSPRYGELVFLDRRSGDVELVDSTWVENFSSFSLSPDGRRLAVTLRLADFGGQTQVYVKALGGGPPVALTPAVNRNDMPAWSPDGQTVLFRTDRTGTAEVYSRRADGAAPAEPLLKGGGLYRGARYTSNGRWLLFTEGDSIFALPTSGGAEPRSLGLRSPSGDPGMVSPDGRWLAYADNAPDEPSNALASDVYVAPFPNTSDGRWRISSDGGFSPKWSHSGRELFFQSASREVVAVEVLPGATFQTGARQTIPINQSYLWFRATGGGYDIMPDDNRFVMIRMRSGVVGNELVIVENFVEDLRADR